MENSKFGILLLVIAFTSPVWITLLSVIGLGALGFYLWGKHDIRQRGGAMPFSYFGFVFMLVCFPIAKAYWFVMKYTVCKVLGHTFKHDSMCGCDMCTRCQTPAI